MSALIRFSQVFSKNAKSMVNTGIICFQLLHLIWFVVKNVVLCISKTAIILCARIM